MSEVENRKLLVLVPPVSVSTFVALMNALGDEFPNAYMVSEPDAYIVWTGSVKIEATDWAAFAGDLLSNDPERIKRHMPEWLQDLMDSAKDGEG